MYCCRYRRLQNASFPVHNSRAPAVFPHELLPGSKQTIVRIQAQRGHRSPVWATVATSMLYLFVKCLLASILGRFRTVRGSLKRRRTATMVPPGHFAWLKIGCWPPGRQNPNCRSLFDNRHNRQLITVVFRITGRNCRLLSPANRDVASLTRGWPQATSL